MGRRALEGRVPSPKLAASAVLLLADLNVSKHHANIH